MSALPANLAAINQKSLLICKQKGRISNSLARLYEVEHRVLMQAVPRNAERFPEEIIEPVINT